MRPWALLLVIGWPAVALAQGVTSSTCSVVSQNLTVRAALQDAYLWYRELPDVDPARFASPESYLDAVRFRAFDSTFSYISAKASDEAYFGRSQFIGFGFSTRVIEGRLVVAEVFPGGPAAEAGWRRGIEIVSIDGVTSETAVREGTIDAALGVREAGVAVGFEWAPPGETPRATTLVKRVVTIPTVADVTVLERAGRRIGYFVLRNFVDTTVAALDRAFAELHRQSVDELVVDVRYNGGGFVSVAQHLAGLVGGTRTAHQVFAELAHSDRLRARDRVLRFPTPRHALGLSRVVVITTRTSASASELVINALRPFVTVVTVGDRTLGKPVGQYSIEFCDKVLHPVAFLLRNADKHGAFFDGIPADCPAPDDVGRALGDPGEASLAEALYYLQTGTCRAAAGAAVIDRAAAETGHATPAARPARSTAAPARPSEGWQALVNAW